MDKDEIEVRRSQQRRRTVSAYREGGRTIVLIPARFSADEEHAWVDAMIRRLAAGDKRRRPSDAQLLARSAELSRRHLGGLAKPTSIVWVNNQSSRWGSCTPADGTIRISERVKGMPSWVLDYVMLHELTHLLQPGHGPEFWALLESYQRTERARGYLEGVAATAGLQRLQDETHDQVEPVDKLESVDKFASGDKLESVDELEPGDKLDSGDAVGAGIEDEFETYLGLEA